MSPGLTINLGMRWEYTSPVRELYGRLVNLDVIPLFRSAEPVIAADPKGPLTGRTYPEALMRPIATTSNHVSPLLGALPLLPL